MAGVNKVILLGRLGNNPEMSYTQSGMAVSKFSIATSKKKKDGEEITSWHRCTAWGRTAEVITQYVSKGQQLYVEGELSYGQYEKDGIVRYTTDIFVNEFSFISDGSRAGQQQGYDNQGYQQPQQFQQQRQSFQQNSQQRAFNQPPQQNFQQAPPQSQPEPSYPGDDFSFSPPKDDDIPF